MRNSSIHRKTSETDITIELEVDGSGARDIDTGVGFLDHMLSHVSVHGLFDLNLKVQGDLHVDMHHTLEDTALVLGTAFDEALGEREGIIRIGSSYVPMDEALSLVIIDLSGRPFCSFAATWNAAEVGAIPTSLIQHFFQSFSVAAKCNLHARVVSGGDDHHQAEALFKAFGRALDDATRIDPRRGGSVPSTKGTLT